MKYILSILCIDSTAENIVADLVARNEFLPLATSSEVDCLSVSGTDSGNPTERKSFTTANSADLLNAVKLYGNISDRAAIMFLELAKLPGFHPDTIKHSDIKQHEDLSSTSLIVDILRCRHCGIDFAGQTECSQKWYVDEIDMLAPPKLTPSFYSEATAETDTFVQAPIKEQLTRVIGGLSLTATAYN